MARFDCSNVSLCSYKSMGAFQQPAVQTLRTEHTVHSYSFSPDSSSSGLAACL